VNALLEDNNLSFFKADTNDITLDTLIQSYYKLITNKKYIKHKLSKVYECCHRLAIATYNDMSLYIKEKTDHSLFYIYDSDVILLYNTIIDTYKSYNVVSASDKAMVIIFLLTRAISNEYTYGLTNKIEKQTIDNGLNVNVLKDDILWLIQDCIQQKNKMFYEAARHIIMPYILSPPCNKYNFKYIDQDNYKGLHRSGWSYVVENLNGYSNSDKSAVLCDLYLDRTFHWDNDAYSTLKVIPYTRSWIGFIHHTCETDYTDYNTTFLFKNKNFLDSLPCCKGLIVLSKYLKNCIETLLASQSITNISVFELTHPTEFVNKCFDMSSFMKNKNRKMIQIGMWMRKLDAINHVNLKDNPLSLTKCVLKCKQSDVYYHDGRETTSISNTSISNTSISNTSISNTSISNTSISNTSISNTSISSRASSRSSICNDIKTRKTLLNNDVVILDHLNNDDYDDLLSCNIVFINLISASAVNTIIECIVRNTPILVNRLPATVELLGENYPLFYSNLDFADLLTTKKIKEGWKYLLALDKTKFKIETFIHDFNSLHI
jgi:hypothetical protein